MKRALFFIMALLFATIVSAQDYNVLNRFMKKYDQNWKERLEQVGKPMPEFNFNKQPRMDKTSLGSCRKNSTDTAAIERLKKAIETYEQK